MSSPTTRRSGRTRNSASASPAQSSRSRQQPASSSALPGSTNDQLQSTPRSSRRTRGEAAAPASSPMFFQSSSANGGGSDAGIPDVGMEPSSPPRAPSSMQDGGTTPRANGNGIRGNFLPSLFFVIIVVSGNVRLICVLFYRFVANSLRIQLESGTRRHTRCFFQYSFQQ